MLDLKFHLFRANKIFPVMYQEALLNGDDKIPLAKFTALLARRLRYAGERAHVVGENIIQIAEFEAVLCTRNEINNERESFTDFLVDRDLDVGYIVQVCEYPLWGCVFVLLADRRKKAAHQQVAHQFDASSGVMDVVTNIKTEAK